MRAEQPARIGILGHGFLHRTMLAALCRGEGMPGFYEILPCTLDEIPACTLLVAVSDTWDAELQRRINSHSLASQTPWLGLYTEFGSAIIGPCVLPGRSGCATCANLRRINAQENAAEFVQSRECLATRGGQISFADCWLTTFATQILASLVNQEIERFLINPESPRTHNALLCVDLNSLIIHRHVFLLEPHCPDCGSYTLLLTTDTAEQAIIHLQSQPKHGPYTYRVRSLIEEKDQLDEHYVDAETGLICALTKDASNLFANFVVHINLQNGQRKELGIGRAFDFEQSHVAAIAEAVERYGGMRPGGKRTIVRASFKQLGDEALDPHTLGLYTREQYSHPQFPYVEYTENLVFNWVWGYSFQHRRPILVPEQCVYYGLNYWSGEKPFLYEISNGCALGGCMEEAILHGVLEVAERDAFLMTWYAQLPAPRIDPNSAHDSLISLLIERIHRLTGYMVYTFNITLEQGIPCFWVMGVDEQKREDMPRAVCAAGSHLHPEKALINALQELAPIIGQQMSAFRQERGRVQEMLHNPFLVTRMQDHSLLYGLPEAFERLEFLYNTPHRQTFEEAFGSFCQAQPVGDLLDDLNDVIARYMRTGIDTIVVDQTTPEHRLSKLSCVKVLMPGMLPMTFGYHARRAFSFERLHRLLHQSGYASSTLIGINPHPHPFP